MSGRERPEGTTTVVVASSDGWRIEQIYGGMHEPGPDSAELRAWVADEGELGRRVADDFIRTGRCYAGALDRHIFEIGLRAFPDPQDAPKRVAGRERCLCQNHSHFRPTFADGGVHSAPPADRPLTGIFWTANIHGPRHPGE